MSDFADYLKKYISNRSGPERRFGLNALARAMEVSPANLSKVISLKLKVSSDMENKLVTYLVKRDENNINLKRMIQQHNKFMDILTKAPTKTAASVQSNETILFERQGSYRIKKKHYDYIKLIFEQLYLDLETCAGDSSDSDSEDEEIILVNTVLSKNTAN